jgi:(E)-4-hydroxy-3-methylbut-2-enyl-diphosphate synthase
LIKLKLKVPVIIGRYYEDLSLEQLQIDSSIDIGGLFVDGLGDGLFISHKNCGSIRDINKLSFQILQSTRTRITKTDFISCPSCGRTQFDLMETTAMVREKTSHLKGLKIAIMGCIVNGPGEMADADYGYVGTGSEKISLYKGHNVIKKDIVAENSVNELINLIKENGDWVEP